MQDLAKDRAPHYKKSRRFFDGLAMQLVQQQHSLDVFACALDQARKSLAMHTFATKTCAPCRTRDLFVQCWCSIGATSTCMNTPS